MQSAAEQAPTHQGAPAGGLTSHPGSLRPTEIPEGPENHVVERLVRHQLLEPRVLPLELLEPFRLVETQPPILLPPAVVRLLTDPQLLADLGRAQTAAQLHLGLA